MKRNYLTGAEVKELTKKGLLLQRVQVIDKIYNSCGLDVSVKFQMRVVDYAGNTWAPEQYGYSISWECQYTGKRDRCMYYPNTVGMQG